MSASQPLAGPPRPVERFKPTGGHLTGYVGLALVLFAIGYVALAVHSLTGLRVALGAAFFGVVVWATQVRPRATAYPRHVVLKNAVRDTHVPLAQVDEVAMGQTLNLWVGDRRFVCIGIGHSLREDVKARRRRDESTLGTSRMSELTLLAERASNEERASTYQTFVLTRLVELVEQAKKQPAPGPEAPRQVWAWPELAALVVTGGAFAVSLVL